MNQSQPSILWHRFHRKFYTTYHRYDSANQWRRVWRWLGRDKTEAQVAFDAAMADWRHHRTRRNVELRGQPGRAHRRRLTMGDVIVEFYKAKEAQGRAMQTLLHLRSSLKRFAGIYADMPADRFVSPLLQDYQRFLVRLDNPKDKTRKLAPKTVNHCMAAAKEVLRWGLRMGYVPPLCLDVVEALDVPEPEPHGYTHAEAKKMHRLAPERLKPWIALQWLTMCRTTETVRLVQGFGYWVEEDGRKARDQAKARKRVRVFRLEHGHSKTPRRFLAFSPRALAEMSRADPRWTRADSYGRACARACGGRYPHFLRAGAAEHLQRLGVARGDIDLALGHVPGRMSRHYLPIDFAVLRRTVRRIPTL